MVILKQSDTGSGQQFGGFIQGQSHHPGVTAFQPGYKHGGHTLDRIRTSLLAQKPASLEICVLLDKPSRRQVQVPVDWIGLEIPDRFVVGYGLDDDGRHRSLPCIAAALPAARDT